MKKIYSFSLAKQQAQSQEIKDAQRYSQDILLEPQGLEHERRLEAR
jgi:hypothetical protein